ncbi:hypothetical protein [Coraliomargarita parva]|uniref:hypothetical protein n=1 Tax=Coraliomargarita parva TaxID=3014050 RepID=UPI0022B3603B|nr:hypothetical protein [Coraliomargarita parva]
MKLLDKLEKRFGHWGLSHLAMYIVMGQVLAYGLILFQRLSINSLLLVPAAIIEGHEYWRLITFIICPPYITSSPMGVVFLAFYWMIFWFCANSIEEALGTFRLTVYLLLGVVFSIVAAFLGHLISPVPMIAVIPKFLYFSVFLAFATLFPNVEFRIYFVLPVKVKWLAWILAVYLGFLFIFSPSMGYRVAILGPVLNYIIFFAPWLFRGLENRQRRSNFKAKAKEAQEAAFHTCSRCGATDKTHPERHFRYKTVDGEAVCLCDACRESGTDSAPKA